MHQKQKEDLLNAPNTPIYQNKEIEIIMKYTEDDKPLWNIIYGVIDNGAFIIL
jgi:hypothetical protein